MEKNEEQRQVWDILEEDPTKLPPLMKVKPSAYVLDCTPKHVYDLLKAGKLKGCKLGNTWRVNRDSLLKLAGIAC